MRIDETPQSASGKPRRSVSTQAAALAAGAGTAQLIVALIYVAAARFSSPNELGVAVATIALGAAIAGFVDFGTNSYWAREIARGQLSTGTLARRAASKVCLFLLLATTWSIFSTQLSGSASGWATLPIGFSILINQISQVPLRGHARGELIGMSSLVDRLVAAAVFVTVFACGASATFALWISLSAGPLAATVTNWLLTAKESRLNFKKMRWENPWRGAHYYGLSSLSVSAQSLDLPILVLAGGSAVSGVYGAINRWTQPLNVFVGAFASAVAPFAAEAGSWKQLWRHIKPALWIPVVAVAVALTVVITAPMLVPLLIGTKYADSVPALQLLALGVIPAIFNQPLVVIMHSLGHDKGSSIITAICVALQLGALIPLGLLFGALGAATAYIAFQILLLLSHLALVWVSSKGHRLAVRVR